jgi:DNA-binding response OmpR family regulator
MNTINGPDLTKKLRENNYNNIIIGLTGTVIKEDIDNFLNSGANIILQKPLDIKVIKSIIHFITYHGYYSDIFNEIYDKIDNEFV